jgi:D-galactarolactone cycloisomerase
MATTISRVETIGLSAPLDERFGYAQSWVDRREALLVRLVASDGTVGWGECWGPVAGSRETIDDLLAPELVGEDPLRVERLYEQLYHVGRKSYQSIVPLPAISGLDIALWDLKGKLLNQPTYALLGGDRRSRVRAYATGHYFRDVDDLEEQYRSIADEARANADRLGAVKAKVGLRQLGYGHEEDVELVGRIRDAIGDRTDLMVDANYAYDLGTARTVGRALEGLDVEWFEEPVAPEELGNYARLRDSLDVRIAGGECQTPAEFDRLFEIGGLDVVQPDVSSVGGLTPASRIATRAADRGLQVVPHVWGTPVTIAASLHLISTLDGDPWLEFDRSSNPLRSELRDGSFDVDCDGRVAVPDGPGIGVKPDPDAIDEFRV